MYQETSVPDAIKLTDYENKPLEGYYIESNEVRTQFGEQMIHTFQKKDGVKVSFWGFTAANRLLEHTSKGIMVKITYLGKSDVPNKYGNNSHTCSVFFDADDKLDNFKSADPEDNSEDLPF